MVEAFNSQFRLRLVAALKKEFKRLTGTAEGVTSISTARLGEEEGVTRAIAEGADDGARSARKSEKARAMSLASFSLLVGAVLLRIFQNVQWPPCCSPSQACFFALGMSLQHGIQSLIAPVSGPYMQPEEEICWGVGQEEEDENAEVDGENQEGKLAWAGGRKEEATYEAGDADDKALAAQAQQAAQQQDVGPDVRVAFTSTLLHCLARPS